MGGGDYRGRVNKSRSSRPLGTLLSTPHHIYSISERAITCSRVAVICPRVRGWWYNETRGRGCWFEDLRVRKFFLSFFLSFLRVVGFGFFRGWKMQGRVILVNTAVGSSWLISGRVILVLQCSIGPWDLVKLTRAGCFECAGIRCLLSVFLSEKVRGSWFVVHHIPVLVMGNHSVWCRD